MADVLSKTGASAITNGGSIGTRVERRPRPPSAVGIAAFPTSSSRCLRPLKVADCGSKLKVVKELVRAAPPKMKLRSFVKRWWENGIRPNMKEVNSAHELVDTLAKAGDKLVIVDFFSPSCGACKALHPKICQFAETNPEVLFVQVNQEEHRSMCLSLRVHVLPFFRFYRGSQGRVCSFSCTNATIKKFKDALAKHGTDRCSIGPTKGLEVSELKALVDNEDLSFTYEFSQDELKDPAIKQQSKETEQDSVFVVTAWR